MGGSAIGSTVSCGFGAGDFGSLAQSSVSFAFGAPAGGAAFGSPAPTFGAPAGGGFGVSPGYGVATLFGAPHC